jgi:glycosyltransferase involved in cell wall biosynthesis
MAKIAVGIMVKNESHIIERCLNSILPLADIVIITDTGSTDDTVMKAALYLQQRGVAFKIYGEPFVNFGHNRNAVLKLAAQEPVDYILMIDADEVVVFEPDVNINKLKEGLSKSYYEIRVENGSTSYLLPRLTQTSQSLAYFGVVHEFLNTLNVTDSETMKEFYIFQINDSYRRVNNIKTQQEIDMMEAALKVETHEPLKARYHFYLAQAYQNLSQFDKAKENYLKRIESDGWREEIYYSCYQMGRIEFHLNPDSMECVRYLMKASELSPHRAESLNLLREIYEKNRWHMFAHMITEKIKAIPIPLDGLFIEVDKYDFPKPN